MLADQVFLADDLVELAGPHARGEGRVRRGGAGEGQGQGSRSGSRGRATRHAASLAPERLAPRAMPPALVGESQPVPIARISPLTRA